MKIYQVDAFTDRPFSGNPAAVCILDGKKDASWMQHVASEMNLSETAFLFRQGEGFSLRWFTPTVEVDLCGHATLASAHVLWQSGLLLPQETALFYSQSGILKAKREGDFIELDFPAEAVHEVKPPGLLLEALGVEPNYVGLAKSNYLLLLASEEDVRSVQPDFPMLAKAHPTGVIVTSGSASGDYDFVSRFFDPGEGINEDPVTGSAHCSLGPFWMGRLGKDRLLAHQASQRGGDLRVRVQGERVYIGGKAVTVMQGELLTC